MKGALFWCRRHRTLPAAPEVLDMELADRLIMIRALFFTSNPLFDFLIIIRKSLNRSGMYFRTVKLIGIKKTIIDPVLD